MGRVGTQSMLRATLVGTQTEPSSVQSYWLSVWLRCPYNDTNTRWERIRRGGHPRAELRLPRQAVTCEERFISEVNTRLQTMRNV